MPSEVADRITLRDAAVQLGVHYMTVYRRVRLGILPAVKVDGTWWVDPLDLANAGATRSKPGRRKADAAASPTIWRERLTGRMTDGDLAGSWQVVEAAMASGLTPADVYVDVLGPALHGIGEAWRSGRLGIDQEHYASNVAASLIGRMSARFNRRGRTRGVVIVAMPPGERHGLGVGMVADLLRQDGYEVRNLGADTPARSLVSAMHDTDRLMAVVVSVVGDGHRPAAARLLGAARREDPTVPLLAGGFAIRDDRTAMEIGADGWVADPRVLGRLIETLQPSSA
jgi:MerR family transcriptional regulator, light-induced transcriptional regulator